MQVRSFYDLDLPVAGCRYSVRHFRPLISGIPEYLFDERKAPAHTLQEIACAITVLNIGGQNTYAEQKTERIDEDVALAPRDFLARIEALRINRGAPF